MNQKPALEISIQSRGVMETFIKRGFFVRCASSIICQLVTGFRCIGYRFYYKYAFVLQNLDLHVQLHELLPLDPHWTFQCIFHLSSVCLALNPRPPSRLGVEGQANVFRVLMGFVRYRPCP